MSLHSLVDFAAVAICSVYCTIPLFWIVTHGLLPRWRGAGRRAYAALLPLWAVFAFIAFALTMRLRHIHLYQSWLAWIPGALFILMGFMLYQTARQGFDRTQISGLAELEPERHRQQLITSGIRSQVRHPIYLGHFCEVFGWMLGTGSIAIFVLLVFGAVTGAVMLNMEDHELEARFGEAYRRYRESVPAFLPKKTPIAPKVRG